MNRDSYNAIATEWDAARRSFSGSEQRYVETLLDGLPVPASILDVGCGTGRPMAEYVLERGHRITGIDQSEDVLAIARERFPQATWVHSRIEDYQCDGACDAVICWDSIFHIDRAHHERILTGLFRSLRPGGRIMLTVGGSEHPAFTDTMFGHEFYYDSHPPDRVVSMMKAIGYEILIQEFMNLPTGGRDKGRYAIVARKAPNAVTVAR